MVEQIKQEIFNCQFCNKIFSTKSNLKTHQKNTKKCLLLRREQGIIDNFSPPTTISPVFGLRKSNSELSEVSSIDDRDINDNDIRYLIESQRTIINYITILSKQLKSVSECINKLDCKYQNILPITDKIDEKKVEAI